MAEIRKSWKKLQGSKEQVVRSEEPVDRNSVTENTKRTYEKSQKKWTNNRKDDR